MGEGSKGCKKFLRGVAAARKLSSGSTHGLVGYDDRLTRGRSPVQFRVGVVFGPKNYTLSFGRSKIKMRRPGIEPGPPAWKAGILATELSTHVIDRI